MDKRDFRQEWEQGIDRSGDHFFGPYDDGVSVTLSVFINALLDEIDILRGDKYKCPACHGTGIFDVPTFDRDDCAACDGTGLIGEK